MTGTVQPSVRNNAVGTPVSPRWDISQERAFTETLVGQRVNFLLVFFGLIIAGGIQLRSHYLWQGSILSFGTFIAALLTLAIMRAQHKLELIFDELQKDPEHPYTFINDKAGSSGSMRRHIGRTIPISCCVALVAATLLSWSGLLSEHPAASPVSIQCAPVLPPTGAGKSM